MTDYVEMAKQALEHPSDFGWFGRDDMFVTWGITGPHWAVNSDDVLAESNFDVFKQMAHEKFGTDDDYLGPHLDIVGISHWAVGSMDSVICKVLYGDDSLDADCIDEEDLTEEFKWVCDVLIGLRDDYPVLDDDHLANLEYDRFFKSFVDYELPFECVSSDENASNIIDYLANTLGADPQFNTVDEDQLYEAIFMTRSEDYEFSGEEWEAWKFLNPGIVEKRLAEDWRIAGQLQAEF